MPHLTLASYSLLPITEALPNVLLAKPDINVDSSMGFTDKQWRSLAIVPHFTSALSMIGDTWILFDILWRRRRNKSSHQMQPNNNNNTTCTLRFKSLINYITNSISSYHRIIMMMSIWDFIEDKSGRSKPSAKYFARTIPLWQLNIFLIKMIPI